MKKLTTLLLIVVTLILTTKVYAADASSNTEQITNYTANYVINKSGIVDVTETIDYFFPSPRHGIFRNLPIIKTNMDGKNFALGYTGFSVTDMTGRPYIFQKTDNGHDISLKIGDPNKTIDGSHTYIIKYKVSGAITYFTDHDELYWNVTGNGWPVAINSVKVSVNLPAGITSSQVNVACFTGPLGSKASDCVFTKSDGNILINTSNTLATGSGITFVAGFPKGFVDVIEPKPLDNVTSTTGNSTGIAIFSILFWFLVFLIGAILLPGLVFLRWFKDYQNGKKAKIVAAWFDPPKDQKGKPLPPAETTVLVDKGVDNKDITATLIQLAQKGFLKIIEVPKQGILDTGHFDIEILGKDRAELESFECYILESLDNNSTKGIVDLKKLASNEAFGRKLSTFNKKVSQDMVDKGFFKDNPQNTRDLFAFLTAFSFILFDVPLALVCLFFGRNSARRTDLGVEKYGEAVSLKNFLSSQNEQLDFQAKNQMFFEKLLPYATAFGVEKIWAERFKDITLIKPEWYEGQNFNYLTYSAFSHTIASNIQSSYMSSMSSSRSSSGFSSGFSGGGHSGGGGGGGGGGSW